MPKEGRPLSCECGREVPVIVLWTALSKDTDLRCRACGSCLTIACLRGLAEDNAYVRTVYAVYAQIVRYGWTSSDALVNAGVNDDTQMIGGLLTGLRRAGLIQKIKESGRAKFEPGPRFPHSKRLPQSRD
jgi:hypothetical protein